MRRPHWQARWRLIAYSAAPCLAVLAVGLLQREGTTAQLLGVLAGGAAVLALILPRFTQRRR